MNQRWRAIYNDKTTLPQYDLEGKPNGYQNIDRTKLIAFEIYIPDGDIQILENLWYDEKGNIIVESRDLIPKDRIVFRLHLDDGQKLILRILGIKTIFVRTGKDTKPDDHLFMVGWQQNVNGKNIQSIAYVYPDGHVEQAGKWIGNPPTLRPEEL